MWDAGVERASYLPLIDGFSFFFLKLCCPLRGPLEREREREREERAIQ